MRRAFDKQTNESRKQPIQMAADVRNVSRSEVRMPGTSVKRSHSRTQVPLRKKSKLET
jgi:hypothetical protein